MNVAHLYAPPAPSAPDAPSAIASPIPFTVSEVIGQALRSYRPQALRLSALHLLGLGLVAVFSAMCAVAGLVVQPAAGEVVSSLGSQLVSLVFSSWISVGLSRLSLAAARGQRVTTAMLFSGGDALLPMIGATLVSGFLLLCGFLALIIPGVVLTMALLNVSWLIADKRGGAFESITLSQRTTRGHRWQLFLLGIANSFVLLLGVLALGIGVLVAYPVASLAMAHAYLHMIGEPA